jgi:Zn-finger nucleic acid-binding protein
MSRRVCPDCGVPLFAARKEGYRIDGCGVCGGAWLDHPSAQRAFAERSLVPASLADEAAAHAAALGPPDRPGRDCPDCRTPLAVTRIPDARAFIDVCAEHGAWFDPTELRRVTEAVVRRSPPKLDPEVEEAIRKEALLGQLRPPANYVSRSDLPFNDAALDGLEHLLRWFCGEK